MSIFPAETIVAMATPVGRSAIAMVRASGPACAELGIDVLRRKGTALLARRAVHGPYFDRVGQPIDDVVVVFYQGPASYTGHDSLEITCHGNPLIAQAIMEDMLARGCRAAEPGEFTRTAFSQGKIDLTQAEAVVDLINANSLRATQVAHRQLRGGLRQHLTPLTETLLRAIAQVEAYIDFPDEDLPPEDRTNVTTAIETVLRGTERLLATQHYGDLLRDGIKTVILGEPNAGKSSLLNRLVGKERALVSPEPGTTRDYIEERIIVEEHAIRLIDTAGLNPTPAAVEALGIAQTLERAREADLFLWVVDATKILPPIPSILVECGNPTNVLLVYNKSDLPHTLPPSIHVGFKAVVVSALIGSGVETLRAAISAFAESFRADQGSEAIAINARHADALRRATACLNAGRLNNRAAVSTELLSSDLRGALDALGEIGGRIDNERMLDHLFATFCIGK